MRDLDCERLYEDAAFYDVEFADRDNDIDFYRRWALRAAGDVLEIACGTGRITLPLARAGVPITGLDVSKSMLALARRKAAKENLQVEWVHADCRAFSLSRTFRLIFVAANALQHLHDLESLEVFSLAARRHLDANGILIVEVFNPNVVKLSREMSTRYPFKEFTDSETGQLVRVEAASRYSAADQMLHFELLYSDDHGQFLRSKQVAMRCFFPQELDLLCRHVGLSIEHKFGDYDERPFSSGASKQILVCRDRDDSKGIPMAHS